MTITPSTSTMTVGVLSAFWGTRRTVRVTLTLKGPDNANRVTTADMPGLLAEEILTAMLRRPYAVATPLVGPRGHQGSQPTGLTVHAPASRALGATTVYVWADFDGTPECVAYLDALRARSGPVLSTATAPPVWPSGPGTVYVTLSVAPCQRCEQQTAKRRATRRDWRARTGRTSGG